MNMSCAPRSIDQRIIWSLVIFVLWPAGASPASPEHSLQPPGWDAGLRLRDAVDINPDPRILEIRLEARVARVEVAPGETVEAWTYDGGLPGPLIRLRVGDRLVAHFTNKLPQPTTVHWHGLRVPIQMDGVPGHSQPDVQPGESFTYDFIVPDAGLFWYHPHVMSAAQVGFGLYGPLLVEDPNDTVGVADELVLVLSDISIDDGMLERPDAGGVLGMLFGREGTHVLVNGRTDSTLIARTGAPQRWRVVNAAKSRYFDLDLGETRFRQIGGDGGLQEFPVDSNSVVLAPGERADLIVIPAAGPGQQVTLRSVIVNRGFGSFEGRFPYDDLLTMTMADVPAYSGPAPRDVRRSIEPLEKSSATAVDLEFTVTQPADAPAEYVISGARISAKDRAVKAEPGETQIWVVTNKTSWSHPLHLHGFFFQVLDDRGAPVRPMAWKDTVNIPFEKTVRLIVRFDDRPGRWMFHCHILDHAEGGLMGTVDVGAVHTQHVHR
jgi:FtsP/CotA-like multicopper oxidase with cupredoxin domain